MALSNYTELKSTIADFLNRDDLTSIIPAFIELAEAQMNRDIRHWRMETRSVGDVDSEYSALPTDWIETISLHVNGDGTSTLNLASREAIANRRAKTEDESGRPRLYAHADGSIELFPTPDKTYEIELLYYAKLDVLSSSNATNWLLDEAPDVYLYGALIHSAPYLQEDARAGTWASMYSAAVQKLNAASKAAQMSGTGLRLNVRGLG
jgi:hypothetical protein